MTGSAPAALDDALVELARVHADWQVPALEVAVVAPGGVAFAGALGQRGVDDPTPIGAATAFHHGSCAKAFTALLATGLAEEGTLDLDAPVRRVVPELRLPDPVLAERITTRDLLAHRSGIGRHDLAWILRPDLDEQGLLDSLAVLAPAGDLRAGFEYSNFGYALAGVVLERVAGEPWTDLLRRRILDPVGMKQTSGAPFPGPDAGADRATPHVLRDGHPRPTDWRSLGAVSPAGQLVTCAEDAVAWLRVQLGDVPDEIPGAAVTATHHPAVTLPPGVNAYEAVQWSAYALGWITGTFRGRPVLWHSGGIDGFLTNTLVLPADGVGVTVSASLHLSDLPFAAVHQLADRLLGTADETSWYDRVRADADGETPAAPPPARAVAGPSHPLADFAGEYTDPGYGSLVVEVAGDELTARLGAGALRLTHRHFDTWDAWYEPLDERFPLTFTTDAEGRVADVVALVAVDAPPVRLLRTDPGGPQ